MAKRKKADIELLDKIDDQIHKHLPIQKLKDIVKEEVNKCIDSFKTELYAESNKAKAVKRARQANANI